MNPLPGKILILLGFALTVLIRIPHDRRNAKIKVVNSKKTSKEKVLLGLVALGFLVLPLIAILTPFISFADYPLTPTAFDLGLLFLTFNIWLFYRSHRDLGTNWSKTLEIREDHKLVTTGVYKRIRHPMYTAIFLYTLAQIFLLSNWLAGPAGVVAFSLMYFLRLGPEENMMIEIFGDEYRAYRSRTKRLIPGIY